MNNLGQLEAFVQSSNSNKEDTVAKNAGLLI
jgi:hypothetical protein